MLKSMISAFLMYSRIPMPKLEWKEENRRYALGWFPAVGAVIGILYVILRWLCTVWQIPQILYAVFALLLPILVTGGIHLDGFCDVCDARASFADRKKRLAILSDPHIGSFAVIRVCLYLIIQTALLTQFTSLRDSGSAAFGFILSRSLSALAAVTWKSAKNQGSLQSFVRPSHKKTTRIMIAFWAVLAAAGMVISCPFHAVFCLSGAALSYLYCKRTAYREFGGVTGDICGWFLQICEIVILCGIVCSNLIDGRA